MDETHEAPELFDFDLVERWRELLWAAIRASVATLAVFAPDATRAYCLWALRARLLKVMTIRAEQLGPVDPLVLIAEAGQRGMLQRVKVDRDPDPEA